MTCYRGNVNELGFWIVSSLDEHWVDILVAALIALVGYFGSARFTDMERRHARAEDKLEKIDDQILSHEARLTSVESHCQERHGYD